MPNLTSVGISAGVPNSGTGTVSTLDNLIGIAGTPSAQVQTVQGVTGGTAVKVDGSAVTQPVSGTVTAKVQDAAGNALTSATRGTERALSVQIVDGSGAQVTSFGGSGGTASNFGSAFPTAGTAIGGSDGTNMVGMRIKTSAPLGSDPAVVVALSPNGLNSNGATTSANSAPMVLATDQATIAVSQDTSKIMNGVSGTSLTPKFAKITASASGATTIVAAVAGKKIRVLSWDVVANAAVNFKWQSHVTPTDLTGLYYMSGQGNGVARAFSPVGYFETVSGEALDINLSGAQAVGGSLVYVEV